MNKDIEAIDKNENSKQIVQKTKWRPIYEVTDEDYIKNSNIFPDDFITKCKQFPNEPQTISGVVEKKHKTYGNGTKFICTGYHVSAKGLDI